MSTATKNLFALSPTPFTHVKLEDRFWKVRQEVNRQVTLPIQYAQCKTTGRLDAWTLKKAHPHIFWDSDVAKWIEAVAYSLAATRDARLERKVDAVIGLMAKAQAPDGYLNTHYLSTDPAKRWTNLRDNHELYCAGHLMEGAVAYYQATGKRTFLDIMARYADHIDATFGRKPGQKRGYCGHEEIELALVKLHGATGNPRHLQLARYFIDERGRQPHYFDAEAKARGDDPRKWHFKGYDYCQAHLPVRDQTEVTGHAVRAMYLYTGMADVAGATGDPTLIRALEKIWTSVHVKRLYITGGIGPSASNEGFTFEYDLPNETAYAETCAAIGLVFWNQRMLNLNGDSRYADEIERALYNGVLSGVSLDGSRFFYANPLATWPQMDRNAHEYTMATRQAWFGCACCPPNIARLIASVGQYFYSQSPNAAYIHLYAQGSASLSLGGRQVSLTQTTAFPWSGNIRIAVHPEKPFAFTLALRIPGWCRSAIIKVNGRIIRPRIVRGYAALKRIWNRGDRVELVLAMPVERIEAHPSVRMDCGSVALQRGPIVYCLEAVDNGSHLCDLILPASSPITARFEPSLLGGVTTLSGKATRRDPAGWTGRHLYQSGPTRRKTVAFKAVPYYAWDNRTPGEMQIWTRSNA